MVCLTESKLPVIWFAVGLLSVYMAGHVQRSPRSPMVLVGAVYLYPVLPLYGRSEDRLFLFLMEPHDDGMSS